MSRKTRKMIWAVPLVAVFAIVGALALFMTLTPNSALAQTGKAPGQPGELMAMPFAAGIPQQQIELKWTAPDSGGPPTHYRIDISMNGGNTWTALQSNVTGDRFLHMGLKSGETFHYRIFAFNGGIIGPMSNVASATTFMAMKPEKPVGLNAEIVGGDADIDGLATTAGELTITLTWSAPPDQDGAPVLGYVVQYALHEAPGAWAQAKVVGDVVTTTHAELEAGRGYRYRIAAYNKTMADGKPDPSYMSDWSVPDSANTLPGAVPTAPQNGSAGVSPAEAKIFLYWTPPATDPLGDPITHYIVQGRPTQDDAERPNSLGADVAPFVTIKDNISSSTSGGKNAASINSFEVTLRDIAATGARENDANAPSKTYASLFKAGVAWEYQIAAKNRSANRASATLDYTAAIAVPARSTNAPLAPVNLRVAPGTETAHNEGRTALTLTWNTAKGVGTAADTDASTYRIEYSDTGPGDAAGYDWRVLVASHTATADSETQTYTDGAAAVDGVTRLAANTTRHYRVFAVNTGTSWPSNPKSGTTRSPKKPGQPTALAASPGGHTSINLTWTAPDGDGTTDPGDNDDGSEEGPSVIKGYYIQYLEEDGTAWQYVKNDKGGNLVPLIKDKNSDGKDDDGRKIFFTSPRAGSIRFTDAKLAPNTTREYRVAAVNMIRTAEQSSDWTDPKKGMTVPIPAPNAPAGLIAEAMGKTTIFLSWLAQAEVPEHAAVTGYVIQYRDGDSGDFMELTTVMMMTDMAVHTIYTDETVPPGTERHYRVYAENAKGLSDQFDMASATTDPAEVPGMPTMVTATTNSDTAITVEWEAPADNGGADITRYIIERRYTGDMMGDIPSDGYSGMDGANRSFAFSNAMEWWETLNCKGMLAAAGSDADPTMDSDDKMTYCGHFLNTEPSNVTDSAHELSDDAKAAVEALFAKRFILIDDVMTMSHMDTGLMEMTAYTYRVSAVNSVGRSAWSAADSATTDASNMAPTDGPDLTATVTAGETTMVQSTISDPDTGDTLTWATATTSSAPTIATATVNATTGKVTIMGHMAGMAIITVTAMDAAGESAMQDIMVTVEAAETPLGPPTNVEATVDDSDPGSFKVTITWTDGANADGHEVGLVDLSDYRVAHEQRAPAGMSHTFSNVASGRYMAIVVSTQDTEFLYAVDIVTVQ